MSRHRISRRTLLAASAASLAGLGYAAPPPRRLRVAAVYTVLRFRSHAFNFLESFLRPYLFRGEATRAGMDVVSLYADQRAADGDLTDDVARRFKIPVFKTIDAALTLGGKDLAVDAVLSIGEHGDYPVNKLGQTEYPRKRFFDEIVAVMRRSRRFVPVFNDKHLSFRWDWAREIYDTARRLGIPLMAGSSVPLAERRPALEPPAEARIEEAVAIHGGGVESYDFHAFEILQSLVEARRGGETGISHVQFLQGDALWNAAKTGAWSPTVAEAALRAEFGAKLPDWRRPMGKIAPHGILLTYRDGLRGMLLKIGAGSVRWNLALKLAGEKEPRACRFHVGPWGNRNLFMALSHAIQHFFRTREAPYPVERTLLASGVLDAAMHSRAESRRLATPHLEVAYRPRDFRAFRETGASWRVLEKVREPKDLDPAGRGDS
ncbi:MAG: hypothetical protein U0793_28490 [Gemmataceae bacterium]